MTEMKTIREIIRWHYGQCPESSLTENAVRRAVKDGKLPHITTGNRTLISTETFAKWLLGETNND